MRLRSIWHLNRVAYFLLDYVLVCAAVHCAFAISPYQAGLLTVAFRNAEHYLVGYGMPVVIALGLQLVDLQRPRAGFQAAETIVRALSGIGIGMLVFAAVYAVVQFSLIGRYVIVFTWLYGTAFVLGSRMVLWKLAEHDSRRVLLYGSENTHTQLAEMVKAFTLPVRLVGYTSLSALPSSAHSSVSDAKGSSGKLLEHCVREQVDEVVVEVPDSLTAEERRSLSHCTWAGLPVSDLSLFFERSFEQVYVAGLREAWFWTYDPIHAQPWYFAFKRFTDIALSLGGLVVSLPFLPFLALAIKLQDGGPVIYSQTRLGRHNQHFKIYKFRTMRVDAESSGAQWAKPGDDRATRLGRILRGTRVDEVPQFWNILMGEMSFIGPRPERPEFVEQIERELPFYSYRHLVKPGLSGWAQVNYPYGASVDDTRRKLAYDLYYLKHASVPMDLLIVFRTVVAMVKGAR